MHGLVSAVLLSDGLPQEHAVLATNSSEGGERSVQGGLRERTCVRLASGPSHLAQQRGRCSPMKPDQR